MLIRDYYGKQERLKQTTKYHKTSHHLLRFRHMKYPILGLVDRNTLSTSPDTRPQIRHPTEECRCK